METTIYNFLTNEEHYRNNNRNAHAKKPKSLTPTKTQNEEKCLRRPAPHRGVCRRQQLHGRLLGIFTGSAAGQ